MEVVLDSNVLFRTLISSGNILELFFDKRLKIIAPEKLREEFFNNRDEILRKSRLSEAEFAELTDTLFQRIELEKYQNHILSAKKLLGKHEKDEDFLALSLFFGIKIWSYESLLFEIGTAISTKEIVEKLKAERNAEG